MVICAFVFAYAKPFFSHDGAHMLNQRTNGPENAHLRSGIGDLSRPYHKKGQGHPGDHYYTNFVELHSLMLGHVTLTIYINFHSPFLRKFHMMFGFDWQNGFIEDFLILW